jgi:hypothetical protein
MDVAATDSTRGRSTASNGSAFPETGSQVTPGELGRLFIDRKVARSELRRDVKSMIRALCEKSSVTYSEVWKGRKGDCNRYVQEQCGKANAYARKSLRVEVPEQPATDWPYPAFCQLPMTTPSGKDVIIYAVWHDGPFAPKPGDIRDVAEAVRAAHCPLPNESARCVSNASSNNADVGNSKGIAQLGPAYRFQVIAENLHRQGSLWQSAFGDKLLNDVATFTRDALHAVDQSGDVFDQMVNLWAFVRLGWGRPRHDDVELTGHLYHVVSRNSAYAPAAANHFCRLQAENAAFLGHELPDQLRAFSRCVQMSDRYSLAVTLPRPTLMHGVELDCWPQPEADIGNFPLTPLSPVSWRRRVTWCAQAADRAGALGDRAAFEKYIRAGERNAALAIENRLPAQNDLLHLPVDAAIATLEAVKAVHTDDTKLRRAALLKNEALIERVRTSKPIPGILPGYPFLSSILSLLLAECSFLDQHAGASDRWLQQALESMKAGISRRPAFAPSTKRYVAMEGSFRLALRDNVSALKEFSHALAPD